MLQYLHDGGPPAWLVSIVGLLFCFVGGLFLRDPHREKLPLLRALSWVIVATMVGGFSAGVGISMGGLPRLPPELKADWPFFLMAGIQESLAIVVLGCSFLAVGWLLASVGLRRLVLPAR